MATTGNRGRDIYTSVKDKYLGKYGRNTGIVITQSYLRLQSAPLSTGSSVEFGVLVNETAQGAVSVDPSEKRLNLVDNFLVTEMRLSLAKKAVGQAHVGQSTLKQFPNPLIFAAANEAKNLMEVYNGFLSCIINGETILDSWDLLRHYRVGTAQEAVMLNATGGAADAYQADNYDSASYGYFPVTPQIELRGNAKNKFRINLPDSVSLAGAAGESNYLILEFRGLLIQNGSTIAQK
jgi:hypothetical protein